ncbi:DoxX family protein [Glycomyces tenuis]|uniref:DoxX family protein n=1 Tax=Glycomyces tenuis TaxID=58116 RepID=UPI0004173531|nr:DoxX family protein [Glycomyces tenuis]
MFIATVVCSALLGLAFLGSGLMKAIGKPDVVEGLGRLEVSPPLVRAIGALEVAGAVGALVGLAVPWLGIAAAVGLALLMIGAIGFHARAGDYSDPKLRGPAFMPIVLLLLAAATAMSRFLSI